MKHRRGVHEEEEHHCNHNQAGDGHTQAHKDGGRAKGGRKLGNATGAAAGSAKANQVVQPALTDEILAVLQQATAAPEAKVARASAGGRVAQPLRLHKDHHVDDGKAQAEDGPEDADGLAVAGVHVATVC